MTDAGPAEVLNRVENPNTEGDDVEGSQEGVLNRGVLLVKSLPAAAAPTL